MKVLVCGSRTYKHELTVWHALDAIYTASHANHALPFEVVNGGAHGADSYAAAWANHHASAAGQNIALWTHPADWSKYGKKAGILRNAEMLKEHPEIELCLAFIDKPLRESRGTFDMVGRVLNAKACPVVLYLHATMVDLSAALMGYEGQLVWSPRV